MISTACHRYESIAGLSRREILSRAAYGLAGVALSELLQGNAQAASKGLPNLPHFAPKAKRVIFLIMSGGLSSSRASRTSLS